MLWSLISSANHWSGCVDGNAIGVLDQHDARRRCWKVGQIVIEELWRKNSTLCHSCFHISAFRFLLPKMNFGSSVLHVVVEPATECCRNVGVVDTIEQLETCCGILWRRASLLIHLVRCCCC